jgi:RsiW-degrading membrane proteinase PrsW (M82 family)
MAGLWVLLLLIAAAGLPVAPAYIWLRRYTSSMSGLWFLLSLLAGFGSLAIAGGLQTAAFWVLDASGPVVRKGVFAMFIPIALTEETGRLLALTLLWKLGGLFKKTPVPSDPPESKSEAQTVSFGGATGLVAGLGFGVVETAAYGTANLTVALLRGFTATFVHGACGARVGVGFVLFKRRPIRGAGWFLSAVVIHGTYNVMVINPGIPQGVPVLIAFLALFSLLQLIKGPFFT